MERSPSRPHRGAPLAAAVRYAHFPKALRRCFSRISSAMLAGDSRTSFANGALRGTTPQRKSPRGLPGAKLICVRKRIRTVRSEQSDPTNSKCQKPAGIVRLGFCIVSVMLPGRLSGIFALPAGALFGGECARVTHSPRLHWLGVRWQLTASLTIIS
jgi:hypothetical protein